MTAPAFLRVSYADLNARQENFNFAKLAARLADFGYTCLRLSDDWQGADLLACHVDGQQILRVQLKGRAAVDRKYEGKDIHIGFFDGADAYVYPHDLFLAHVIARGSMDPAAGLWRDKGIRSWPRLPRWAQDWLAPYAV
ncbi:MAG: hypothetical protein AAGF60_12345 [Pseudomonadota bacterium]